MIKLASINTTFCFQVFICVLGVVCYASAGLLGGGGNAAYPPASVPVSGPWLGGGGGGVGAGWTSGPGKIFFHGFQYFNWPKYICLAIIS